ncbi:MAG: thiol:disulfide interchange protein [Bacteroidetes bacterium]|nr:thiol:disulfide interchange protein [Bacteroidota bacterium]
MKKLIFLSALLILLMSATTVDQKGYTISGKVVGAKDGDTVILGYVDYMSIIPLDTTIIKNGEFLFSGNQEEPVCRCVSFIKNGISVLGSDFILENAPISITVEENKRGATGTSNNELWNEYIQQDNNISMKMNPFWEISEDTTKTESVREEAKKELKKIEIEQLDFLIKFMRSHITSGVTHILLSSYYQMLEPSRLETILSDMQKAGIKDELYLTLKAKLDALTTTAIGCKFTDIEMNDPEGKPFKLSTIVEKNKITMIDFWASWCGPCRAEIPNVIKAYESYKAKGFEIVGVSFDNNGEAWRKSIKSLGMTWPQMSDLQGWKSKGGAAYDITSIPATVLINQKGEIVAKNLRGEELSKKLEELLR